MLLMLICCNNYLLLLNIIYFYLNIQKPTMATYNRYIGYGSSKVHSFKNLGLQILDIAKSLKFRKVLRPQANFYNFLYVPIHCTSICLLF